MSHSHPQSFMLKGDEASLVAEFLRIGSQKLDEILQQNHKAFPESALNESLRRWIEEASDLQERIHVYLG